MNIDAILRSLGGAVTSGQPADPPAVLQQRFASLLENPLDARSAADPLATTATGAASATAGMQPLAAAKLLELQLALHNASLTSDALSKGISSGLQGLNKLVNQS